MSCPCHDHCKWSLAACCMLAGSRNQHGGNDVISCFVSAASSTSRLLGQPSMTVHHMRVIRAIRTLSALNIPSTAIMTSSQRYTGSSTPEPPAKRQKRSSPSASPLVDLADAGDRFGDEYGAKWADWPAPRSAMMAASAFIRDM